MMARKIRYALPFVIALTWLLFLVAVEPEVKGLGANPAQPPFKPLKDAAWRMAQPPISPANLLAPGRLAQLDLFALGAKNQDTPLYKWSGIVFEKYGQSGWDVSMLYIAWYPMERLLTSQKAADYSPTADFEAQNVAFVSERDGNQEIYRVDNDGNHLQRLTNNTAADLTPAWAPNRDRLAFVRMVSGQEEIFSMNADGSDVVRLTNNTDRDLTPSWSSDGKQIVWVKRQENGGVLWIMNADGTQQRAITPFLPYLQHPRWSPNGDRIAVDYDADGDGFNELAVIKPDGSDLHTVFDAETDLVDLWLGDWSPDGHYLLFTVVLYTIADNQLYVQDSLIGYRALQGGTPYMFDPYENAIEMAPVWRGLDHSPPVSGMNALPAQSPNPFRVSWYGTDQGVSGIAEYDVQVKEGLDGEWRLWKTSYDDYDYYNGVGGHSYYFRVRVRDRAGNVEPWPPHWQAMTTVENLPPESHVHSLEPYERDNHLVQWSGDDPGGSGIWWYDVQYRVGEELAWTDWLTHTQMTAALFPGETGVRTYFRVRATDQAQNVEPWREGDGDTSTIFYGWKVDGTVSDMRDMPLADVLPLTTPEGFQSSSSDAAGAFTVYGHKGVEDVAITWQKPGYEQLPLTYFPASKDAHMQVILPPQDNRIRNGGFEEPLEPAWSTRGEGLQVVTDTQHTGASSLRMGCTTQALAPTEEIPDSTFSRDRAFAVDKTGVVHFVQDSWANDAGLLYWRRDKAGWSTAEHVFNEPKNVSEPRLAVDQQGNVHLIVKEDSSDVLLYILRSPTGEWSAPQVLSDPSSYVLHIIDPVVDSQGTVHVIWLEYDGLFYTNRSMTGEWLPPQRISSTVGAMPPQMLMDDHDNIHVLWAGRGPYYYVKRDADGTWTTAEPIQGTNHVDIATMQSDGQGGVHFLFSQYHGALFYQYRSPDGTFSGLNQVNAPYPLSGQGLLAVTKEGLVHILWPTLAGGHNNLIYLQRKPDGTWTSLLRLPYGGELTAMLVDQIGRLHVVWKTLYSFYYTQRGPQGNWLSETGIQYLGHYSDATLALGSDGTLHFLFNPISTTQPYAYTTTLYQDWPARIYAASQQVVVPDASVRPTLSLLYRLQTTTGIDSGSLQIDISNGISTSTPISLTTDASEWRHQWADMSNWAGQTVTLTLSLHQPPAAPCARAYVDDLSLGRVDYPDLWVLAPATPLAPGDTADLRLFYGNSGPALSHSTQLTLTLPLSLSLVAADPPPTTTPADHVWSWDVGDLAPQETPATVRLTVAAPANLPPGSVLTGTLSIDSATVETDTRNNEQPVVIFVGGESCYLPLMKGGP